MNKLLLTLCCILLLAGSGMTQDHSLPARDDKETEDIPFKILTSGKKITIQSKSNIRQLMLWTASGHRVAEEHAINSSSYTYQINVQEKIFFVMLQLANGKRYTKKIGIE